ncbi:hypothetical protein T4A_4285 [Trichinella pseudospiralis]|uniref:Uncharacterized protein n=1 Tax=Trichinella pseudospiralis TaxID=6337 RepID=A0A0V1K6K8_TRIPS|nr:hypothetical protein T4A_4285 [Trichinella pseudospiralis]KRZ42893.1 hypothetical protein T4C_10281 [Trichinella pseudospiralis]
MECFVRAKLLFHQKRHTAQSLHMTCLQTCSLSPLNSKRLEEVTLKLLEIFFTFSCSGTMQSDDGRRERRESVSLNWPFLSRGNHFCAVLSLIAPFLYIAQISRATLLALQPDTTSNYSKPPLSQFRYRATGLLKKGWPCFLKVALPDLASSSELAFREFCKFIWQLNIRRSRRIHFVRAQLGVLILPYRTAVDGECSTIPPATSK